MQTSNNYSAIQSPLWLTVVVILLLASRAVAFISEKPQHSNITGVAWNSASSIDLTGSAKPAKLVLYDFAANWCQPCKQMDDTTLLNKDVLKIISEKFLPVRVMDKRSDHGASASKDPLADQLEEKYSIFAYPTYIVTLPNGKEVDRRMGMCGVKSMTAFLTRSLSKATYTKGLDYLAHGRYSEAADTFSDWLHTTSIQDKRMRFDAALYLAVANQMQKKDAEAANVINEAVRNYEGWESDKWPLPVAELLLGKVDPDQLAKDGKLDRYRKARARYFIGMVHLKQGKVAAAKEDFEFASKNTYADSEISGLVEGQLSLS